MKNEDCIIGLFQGMFEKNMLTFNPGWNSNAEEVNPFKDVRQLQEELREKGIAFVSEADPESEGPPVSSLRIPTAIRSSSISTDNFPFAGIPFPIAYYMSHPQQLFCEK